jgi:tetratricopeptide (TPR) repeat protein
LQALADLNRAAGFDLKDQPDRQVIGETAAVYRSLGQPQRALGSMQSLVETYSPGEEPQQVLYRIGLDYMALRRYDDAVTSLTTALSRDRPAPELLYCLGEAQYRRGRSQEAATALQQALAIDPQHVPSRQLLYEIQVAQQPPPAVRR